MLTELQSGVARLNWFIDFRCTLTVPVEQVLPGRGPAFARAIFISANAWFKGFRNMSKVDLRKIMIFEQENNRIKSRPCKILVTQVSSGNLSFAGANI